MRRSVILQGAGVLALLAAIVGIFLVLNPPAGGSSSSVTLDQPVGELPVIGEPAPLFSATTLDGEEVRLADYQGTPVWLIVNATWCTSCRAEIPDIQRIADSERGEDIQILSVYLGEGEEIVSEFNERLGITYTSVPDPANGISAAYAVPAIPVHYFIDAEGVTRSIEIGSISHSQMEAELDAIS
ncbi:MAG: TlpA disulfide reductase family protein [bacterium]|nr:TlpA disulfide reductase family protein [bacterium]